MYIKKKVGIIRKVKSNYCFNKMPSKDFIHKGTMQYLFSIGICDAKSVNSVIKRLQDSSLVISENEANSFGLKPKYIEHLTQELNEYAKKREDRKNSQNLIDGETDLSDSNDFLPIAVQLITHKTKIVTQLTHREADFALSNLEKMISDKNAGKHMESFFDGKRTDLLLRPIAIKKNNKLEFIKTMLSIFDNGIGVINLECEIKEESFQDISSNMWGLNYDATKLGKWRKWDINNYDLVQNNRDGNQYDLRNHILDAIYNITGQNISIANDYKLLIIQDYDSKPSNYEEISDEYKKNIISLLCAPIDDYRAATKEKNEEVMQKSKYEINQYNFIYAHTTARIVCAKIGDEFLKAKDTFDIKEARLVELLERAAIQGVTPAIEAILLKSHLKGRIASNCLAAQNRTIIELLRIKIEIYSLKIDIINNFRFKYDTMTKLTHFLDGQNTDGITDKNLDEIVQGFDNVVLTKDMIQKSKLASNINVCGFILSIILSYFGVASILTFINTTISFTTPKMIFILTNICWTLIVVIIGIVLKINSVNLNKKLI